MKNGTLFLVIVASFIAGTDVQRSFELTRTVFSPPIDLAVDLFFLGALLLIGRYESRR